MSIINHKLLTQRALPVASQAMSAWVFSRSLMEEDFSPEEDSAGASVTTLPPISVLAVIIVEPTTGKVMGSRWQDAGRCRTSSSSKLTECSPMWKMTQ